MPVIDHFMLIIPRHRQALQLLMDQRKKDAFGGIGVGALREEDDVFTLGQIVNPLMDRGLIEDLSRTELGAGGKYFVRLTPLGAYCLGMGYMLRVPRKSTEAEMKKYAGELPAASDIEDLEAGLA